MTLEGVMELMKMTKWEGVAFCIAMIPFGILVIRMMAETFRVWREEGSKVCMVLAFANMAVLLMLITLIIAVIMA